MHALDIAGVRVPADALRSLARSSGFAVDEAEYSSSGGSELRILGYRVSELRVQGFPPLRNFDQSAPWRIGASTFALIFSHYT